MSINSQLIKLYAEGFPEDSLNLREYFVNTYSKYAQTICAYGKLIAACYLIPRKAILNGESADIFYIDAFSVLKEYRGKGVAQQLMSQILNFAYNNKADFCFLSPFLPYYYHSYGFIDISYLHKEIVEGGMTCVEKDCSASDLIEIYNKTEGNRLVMDEVTAMNKIKEYQADGERLVVLGDFAVGARISDRFEWLCADFDKLKRCENIKGLEIEMPGGSVAVQARVINARKYAGANGVSDSIISANNSEGLAKLSVEQTAETVFGKDYADKIGKNLIFDKI